MVDQDKFFFVPLRLQIVTLWSKKNDIFHSFFFGCLFVCFGGWNVLLDHLKRETWIVCDIFRRDFLVHNCTDSTPFPLLYWKLDPLGYLKFELHPLSLQLGHMLSWAYTRSDLTEPQESRIAPDLLCISLVISVSSKRLIRILPERLWVRLNVRGNIPQRWPFLKEVPIIYHPSHSIAYNLNLFKIDSLIVFLPRFGQPFSRVRGINQRGDRPGFHHHCHRYKNQFRLSTKVVKGGFNMVNNPFRLGSRLVRMMSTMAIFLGQTNSPFCWHMVIQSSIINR